ncbi:hypothetical protein GCM10009605_30030 [Nocardiopsis composta]
MPGRRQEARGPPLPARPRGRTYGGFTPMVGTIAAVLMFISLPMMLIAGILGVFFTKTYDGPKTGR